MSKIVRVMVAIAQNGVIGNRNQLPWPKLQSDLAYFRQMTLGSPIIMGGNTWRSLGKPLPGRLNIVISSKLDLPTDENLRVFNKYSEALDFAKKCSQTDYVYVIGGKEIYALAEKQGVDEYLITRVQESFEGDTYYEPLLKDFECKGEVWKSWEQGIELSCEHYVKKG